MIEVENTDVNIVRNLIPMRNHMPASAYGLKAISDWFSHVFQKFFFYAWKLHCNDYNRTLINRTLSIPLWIALSSTWEQKVEPMIVLD